eukprot:1138166-Pelagomonas_calceolata.AAC.5
MASSTVIHSQPLLLPLKTQMDLSASSLLRTWTRSAFFLPSTSSPRPTSSTWQHMSSSGSRGASTSTTTHGSSASQSHRSPARSTSKVGVSIFWWLVNHMPEAQGAVGHQGGVRARSDFSGGLGKVSSKMGPSR